MKNSVTALCVQRWGLQGRRFIFSAGEQKDVKASSPVFRYKSNALQ